MTDSVRYTDEEEAFVDIQPQGYFAPYPGSQFDWIVNNWLAGKTDEWIGQEDLYAQYLLDYAAWEEAGSIPEDEPQAVAPPTPPEEELIPNAIIPYDIYYEVSDEDLRMRNYDANKHYANTVIKSAESSPAIGVNLDERGVAKENDRRDNRAKGKLKLTDNDDHLADYIDACYDTLDLADDEVENLSREGLMIWDATVYSYPVWTPLGGE